MTNAELNNQIEALKKGIDELIYQLYKVMEYKIIIEEARLILLYRRFWK
jgi:hypothetical protein